MFNIADSINTNIRKALLELYNFEHDKLATVQPTTVNGADYVFKNTISVSKVIKKEADQVTKDLMDNLAQYNNMYDCSISNRYINFKLNKKWIEAQLQNYATSSNIIQKIQNPQKILVDFSSPNIAKDMHVGHLRSTIIGDSICRLFEKLGHQVLRINHTGDFGLQFGMLIQYLQENCPETNNITISDLQKFYAESKKKFDSNEEFKKESYNKVVQLQQGEKQIVDAWESIKDISRKSYSEIYDRLDIRLEEVGESFYQKFITNLVDELRDKKLLENDEGRLICKVKGSKVPLTVVKSDGGYTYDTTDLAALRYRLREVRADKIYYVVDVGQSLHFRLLFDVAKQANWYTDQELRHIEFGLVLGPDGGKFRSRDGDTVKLIDLLNEAINKTTEYINSGKIIKQVSLTEEEKNKVIKTVAYSAVKYADLSCTRTADYRFSLENMLALDGNTAPAMLYAYARMSSIIRKVESYEKETIETQNISIIEDEEAELAKHILQFPEILDKLCADLLFHSLCAYVYKLSRLYNGFVEKCRIIQYKDKTGTEVTEINKSRLELCRITKKIMFECFSILGIPPLEKM